ncbi:hypothetical protein [Sneathiella sp.]|uniref:hypothetical protein n=1 Tax=Sneathiella sp. TaxID=1964365 RepID=UPI0035619E1E
MKEDQSAELNRFKAVLDAYGADENRWPAEDIPMMNKLQASSDVARSLLRQEEKFDAILKNEAQLTAPSALLGRVLKNAEDANRGSIFRIIWPFGSFWQPASGLVMAACVGIVLGLASPNILDNGDDVALDEPSFNGIVMYDLEISNDDV